MLLKSIFSQQLWSGFKLQTVYPYATQLYYDTAQCHVLERFRNTYNVLQLTNGGGRWLGSIWFWNKFFISVQFGLEI